jgi:5-methylthioribose kinase
VFQIAPLLDCGPVDLESGLMATLNIEQIDDLLNYLRDTGRLGPGEVPVFTTLQGGVSNRTVLVERSPGQAFVVKQALAKLRVKVEWHSDPHRIHHEALGLIWLARLAPPGTITPLFFEDESHHLLAMQAVPRPHENWKSRLLAGGLDLEHVRQFGQLLGIIHRSAHGFRNEIEKVFADRTFFETLRLEPYYRYTASQNPAAADFYADLIAETEASRETLVHGDYSPKNILIHQHKLVLLDHEVIHFGDPAFDLGFSLTHLLSKAHHLTGQRADFLKAARFYWQTYQEAAGEPACSTRFESRVARHTLGCLLARVDGRSPLEYLRPMERSRQRSAVLSLMTPPPPNVGELIEIFGRHVSIE